MILLLLRRMLERAPVAGFARREGLALVQGLCADLAHVVDPHQRGRFRARAGIQLGLGQAEGRRCARRTVHARHSAQGTVELKDQGVESWHGPSLSRRAAGP